MLDEVLQCISRLNEVRLGLCGVRRNERAYELAKKAVRKRRIDVEVSVRLR